MKAKQALTYKKVTVTTMVSGGGNCEKVYGIYRGKLYEPKNRQPYVKLGERVATVHSQELLSDMDYTAYARQHQTAEYPAFNWGRG